MILTLILAILSLDQITKLLISRYLPLHSSLPILDGFFYLTLVHNSGAAFGIFKNQIVLFIITSIISIILIYINLKREKKNNIYSISLALILSGALGNLIDRLRFGYVIDFFDFRIWPVFNVADSAITIGAILLGWYILNQKSNIKNQN
jgi:signal peptidase II